jgi:uncharacterized protein (DUF736 family)
MPVIGSFSTARDADSGPISTLRLTAKARIPSHDREETSQAPDLRGMAAPTEIGTGDDGLARRSWQRERRHGRA